MKSNELTDDEIRDRLRELDERDDVQLTEWECGFIEGLLFVRFPGESRAPNECPLSDRQRVKALEIIEHYESKGDGGGQQAIVRGPPEVLRHLRRDRHDGE